jgi:hypothetical protein
MGVVGVVVVVVVVPCLRKRPKAVCGKPRNGLVEGASRERETPCGDGDEMTPDDGDGLFVCARRGNESAIGGTGERGDEQKQARIDEATVAKRRHSDGN